MAFDGDPKKDVKPLFAAEPYDYLTLETAALLSESPAQRVFHLKADAYIGYPQANRALYLMQKCFDAPDSTRARGLGLYADSGMGKTHVQVECFRRNGIDPKTKARVNGGQPILYVTLAAATSFKMVLMRFMDAIGMPIPTKVDPDRAPYEIVRHYKLCNYIVTMLEEAQDATKTSTAEIEKVAMFLKLLSNEGGRPIILSGTPDAKTLVTVHDQFRQRMDTMIFRPWTDVEQTRGFIWAILSRCALPKQSPITDDASVEKILHVTRGNTECIAEAIKKSAERAIELGKENFDLKFLLKNGF